MVDPFAHPRAGPSCPRCSSGWSCRQGRTPLGRFPPCVAAVGQPVRRWSAPEPGGAIIAPRQDRLAVRMKGHAANHGARSRPAQPPAARLARGRVPEAGRAVRGAGQDGLAVRAEGDSAQRTLMEQGLANRQPRGRLPAPGRRVVADRHGHLAVGTEHPGQNAAAAVRSGGLRGWPVAASQSRAVLSPEVDRIVWPSGLNVAAVIQA